MKKGPARGDDGRCCGNRTDEEGRRHIWREEWAQYYGDPMSETYVPIQVVPERIEFYDAKIGAHADDGFGPVVVEL